MKPIHEIDAFLNHPRVRKVQLGEHWLYAAVDLLSVLTARSGTLGLWEELKRCDPALADAVRRVKVPSDDALWHEVEMLDIEQALRLAQSVETPLAERIKLWLAQCGRQQLEETADPELAIKRTRNLYEQKGYPRSWIDKRLRGISARQELTGQWYRRGVHDNEQFRALTNELSSAAFGMDVRTYKQHKGLRGGNLRDHMTDLELALTTFSESVAAILHRQRGSQGFEQLQQDVRDAGQVAAGARQGFEQRSGIAAAS